MSIVRHHHPTASGFGSSNPRNNLSEISYITLASVSDVSYIMGVESDTRKGSETMAITTVYRVQPVGLELGSHRSETSNDELDRGVHVFSTYEELLGGVREWCNTGWAPEVVEIECDDCDLVDNGDYEGYVLISNRGRIINRTAYESWSVFENHVRDEWDSL